MNLDYITINGLDSRVKEEMAADMKETCYSGTVSAYVTQLLSEALARRKEARALASKEAVEDVRKKLEAIDARLADMERFLYKKDGEDGVYRLLECRTFRAAKKACYALNVDTEDIDDGKFDKLPYSLLMTLGEVDKQYGNP